MIIDAGDGIRTRESLQNRVLSPAPLTKLGNPCTQNKKECFKRENHSGFLVISSSVK